MKKKNNNKYKIKKVEFKKHKFNILFIYSIIFLIVIFIGVLLILLKNINPETSNIFPPCIVYKLTGIKCAGCGMTRAFHQILNLNFKEAFKLNPLIFIFLVSIIYLIAKYFILKIQKKNASNIKNILKREIKVILYILLIITVGFMILRNVI